MEGFPNPSWDLESTGPIKGKQIGKNNHVCCAYSVDYSSGRPAYGPISYVEVMNSSAAEERNVTLLGRITIYLNLVKREIHICALCS